MPGFKSIRPSDTSLPRRPLLFCSIGETCCRTQVLETVSACVQFVYARKNKRATSRVRPTKIQTERKRERERGRRTDKLHTRALEPIYLRRNKNRVIVNSDRLFLSFLISRFPFFHCSIHALQFQVNHHGVLLRSYRHPPSTNRKLCIGTRDTSVYTRLCTVYPFREPPVDFARTTE